MQLVNKTDEIPEIDNEIDTLEDVDMNYNVKVSDTFSPLQMLDEVDILVDTPASTNHHHHSSHLPVPQLLVGHRHHLHLAQHGLAALEEHQDQEIPKSRIQILTCPSI